MIVVNLDRHEKGTFGTVPWILKHITMESHLEIDSLIVGFVSLLVSKCLGFY
jgi:hypothetical protein